MGDLAKKTAVAIGLLLLLLAAWEMWRQREPKIPAGFAVGNGRIEATEVHVATRLPGRLKAILVEEGTFVSEGTVLALVDLESIQAQRQEAVARLQQALEGVATAKAQVALRRGEYAAAVAFGAQRESELLSAQRRYRRSEELFSQGFISAQVIDNERAQVEILTASQAAAQSQVVASEAAIGLAQTLVTSAIANVAAAKAAIARIEADLADHELRAPRDGRVQYLIARPGEVLGSASKVLSLIDLTDVYMTFFLPEALAGRVPIGTEVRVILDAAPSFVIPAKISFVSSVAQFTPKTVETASEREKLMFRVRAQIDRDLLLRHQEQVKTGLPGVAWVRIDSNAVWPPYLAVHVW
jgi:HlyD family secretion protein